MNMNAISFIFVISLKHIVVFQADCLQDFHIIQNYFNEKSIKSASVFGCFGKTEQIVLAKMLMLQTRSISVLSINGQKAHKILNNNHHHIGVILDGDCPQSSNFLILCGQLKFFDVKHHWLITTTSLNFMKKFENVVLNIDADIQVAVQNSTTLNWTIVDIYNPASKHGGALNYTKLGFYNRKQGYIVRNNEAKYWSRKNMTGITFKSMIVLPVSFKGTLNEYLYDDDNRNINTFNRFHSRLVLYCRDYYNFSLDIEVTKSWGYTNPDGTFDGMVGALERKVIDFGSSPLFVREDRAKVIDYGRNTWILRAGFIFRNPRARTSVEIFLQPLSTSIWLITCFLAFVSMTILKIVTTFERKKYHYSVETSWSLSAIVTLGAFCQQGSPSTPRMTCGRITTISIFLLSVIIYQFYSASLVSHLLMKPVTNIRTLKDLINSPLKAGCEDILYDRDYFKHSTDEITKELLYKKILGKRNTSNFLSPEQGLKLVEQGGYAFHVETATAYPIIEATFGEKAICELREIQLFRTQPMHANFQKHSPFRDMLDTCLQRIAEYGILFRERKHWHPRKPECIQSSKSITFNVSLNEFYPALLVLLLGIISSLTMLILEKQVKMIKEKSLQSSLVFFKKRPGKPAHPPLLMNKRKPILPFVK